MSGRIVERFLAMWSARWERPFGRPASGRIAVKAINHFGDEVMKVFRV